jgi:hypothetical protein
MSVLQGATRPGLLDGLSLQRCLPWGPAHPVAPRTPTAARPVDTKDMHGSGSAGPSHEPPRGVARIAAPPRPQPGGQ